MSIVNTNTTHPTNITEIHIDDVQMTPPITLFENVTTLRYTLVRVLPMGDRT